MLDSYAIRSVCFDKHQLFRLTPLSPSNSSRTYVPPDPPGYFDAYVWPMYLKNRKEMDDAVNDIGNADMFFVFVLNIVFSYVMWLNLFAVFLDGTQRQEELHFCVLADMQEILIVSQS